MGFCTVTSIQGLSIYSEFFEQNPSLNSKLQDNTVLYEFSKDEYEQLKLHLDAMNRLEEGFKWALLPESEHENIKDFVEGMNYEGLLEIHNKYKLSNYPWGCCGLTELYIQFKEYINKLDE